MNPLGSRGQNPRWRPSTRYGPPNFFPMGDKSKILFSSIGFWGTGNALKPFSKLCARYFSWIRRILRFSAGFKHFPSIYHYFDPRNIIFGTISIFWVGWNQMATFIKLSDYQGCQIARYFSSNLLFSAGFNHFPSIYQYFDFRNVILVAMAMLLRTRNPIVTFRTLSH